MAASGHRVQVLLVYVAADSVVLISSLAGMHYHRANVAAALAPLKADGADPFAERSPPGARPPRGRAQPQLCCRVLLGVVPMRAPDHNDSHRHDDDDDDDDDDDEDENNDDADDAGDSEAAA